MIDAHVYCLPDRLRNVSVSLPHSEMEVARAIYSHPEGEMALSLSSPQAILRSMDSCDIATSVLIAFPWKTQKLCKETNDYLLDLVSRENRFACFCSVQPGETGSIREVERVRKAGALGIKVNPAWQGLELNGPEMIDLGSYLLQEEIPLMVHVDHPYRLSPASPAHLHDLAVRLPELRILAAHLGGLLGLYGLHPPVAEGLKNVWFDTAVSSTLEMVGFYVQAGLQDKLVLGSDFPFNHSHSQKQMIQGIKDLGLEGEIVNKIFIDNFLDFLGRKEGIACA